MKQLLLKSVLIAALLGAFPFTAHAQDQTPVIPVGSLSAFPTIVQAGTHPTLTWEITVPEAVEDIIEVIPPGTIKPKQDVEADIRILGASVQTTYTNHRGQVTRREWRRVQGWVSHNGGGWSNVFDDTHDDINSNRIARTISIEEGETLNFGGRYLETNGRWTSFYNSASQHYNVVALKNGDTPPTTTPLYQQPTIESFIRPYLDDENGTMNLGPRDVIYLFELTHTDKNNSGWDLQDLALLITFRDVPN